jgi:hypothetical protein
MHNPTVVHRHAVLGLSGVPASLCACVPPAYVKYYTQEDTPATGLVAEPKGASPPRQLELAPPGTAEFVICDHTIEFLFRDSKQFTGLSDCQARAEAALDFHFNAALATLNLARTVQLIEQTGEAPQVFSMASWKQRQFNERLLDVFIEKLALEPSWVKKHPSYDELRSYGAIAV